jgi:hypothetical protein
LRFKDKEVPDNLIGAIFIFAIFIFVFTAYFVYHFFYPVNIGTSFIDELRKESISGNQISRVYILKFDPGGGWPFKESDYQNKANKEIVSRPHIKELVQILKTDSTFGYKHRNHPATYYFGIMKFELTDKKFYYLYYQLMYYKKAYFTLISANSANDRNPNRAMKFENIPLSVFLKNHDPWYHDKDRPWTKSTRVNSPDNVP